MGKNYNNYYKKNNNDKKSPEVATKTEEVVENTSEEIETKEEVIETEPKYIIGVVNVNKLNFRSEPDKEDDNIISVLLKGETIEVDENWNAEGDWSKGYVNGIEGYVMTEFITFKR